MSGLYRRYENILVAFGSIPKDGGTFTFYRTLRPGLLEHGINLRCVSVGKHDADLWDEAFADDGCVLIAKDEVDIKKQSIAFTNWCLSNRMDIVMGLNSVAILSALPHLPEHIRVMSRCASARDHGYRITVSCYNRLMRIVTTAPRQGRDLVNDYGVQEDRISMIPNGIAPEEFENAAYTPRGTECTLRLAFLSRLERQKGIFFLAKIFHLLQERGVKFTCAIAGKGVHRKALERELKEFVLNGTVTFAGFLLPTELPHFFKSVDVYLFPSLIEGCPNSLIEANMAGCVSVSWLLEGITDFVIQDGVTGFVCPLADCEAVAARIAKLSEQRDSLQKMALAAAHDARERFSQTRAAGEYARLFKELMHTPPPAWTPRPWSSFQPDPAFANHANWRALIPKSFKQAICNCLFHVGLSDRYYD